VTVELDTSENHYEVSSGALADEDEVTELDDLAELEVENVRIATVSDVAVTVTAEFAAAPPTAAVVAALDDGAHDVFEISLLAPTGELRLRAPFGVPTGPNLAGAGPGWYRLHLAATRPNRQQLVHERIGEGPYERHRLITWPAPPAPPRVFRRAASGDNILEGFVSARAARSTDVLEPSGARLVTAWKDLTPPADPDKQEAITVAVEAVIPLPRRFVFESFEVNPADLAAMSGGDPADERLILADLTPDLAAVGHVRAARPFERLEFTWGFQPTRDFRPAEPGASWPLSHPIPAESTVVLVTLREDGPDATHVTLHHDGVPRWLAEDMASLWRYGLARLAADGDPGPRPWDRSRGSW
jgi:hypothetical protein